MHASRKRIPRPGSIHLNEAVEDLQETDCSKGFQAPLPTLPGLNGMLGQRPRSG